MELLSLKQKHEYEEEIADLKLRLRRTICSKSKMKERYLKTIAKLRNGSLPIMKKPTRSDIARKMITAKIKGQLDITIKQIALQVNLSYYTVKDLHAAVKRKTND